MIRHLLTLVALFALLALTTAVAFIDLGAGNTALSLGIAAAKAVLVAAVFMELTRADLHVRLTAAAGLYWLSILIGLTLWVS